MSHCPGCGTKLVLLAHGQFGLSKDDRKIVELAEQSEDWKRVRADATKESSGITGIRDVAVEFAACGHCKNLYMIYGKKGYYMDILGKLTDEAVALIIAKGIKGE